ncbi:MAG: MoaD/ThiS family protein [Pseudomonadales bacterium]|jgi:molybdopterin converting factor small subunit|nr:MoaD/ThiS family protein [Pseudomonadales bacterium]
MATKVIFSSELQKFTGEVQAQVQATNYRGVVAEIVAKYPDLAEDEILKMAVAIDGEIIHDPFLEQIQEGSEVHFLYRISGG